MHLHQIQSQRRSQGAVDKKVFPTHPDTDSSFHTSYSGIPKSKTETTWSASKSNETLKMLLTPPAHSFTSSHTQKPNKDI
jgi:hypothetical protein